MRNKRKFVLGLLLSFSLISVLVNTNSGQSFAQDNIQNKPNSNQSKDNFPDLITRLRGYSIDDKNLWIAISAMIAGGAIGGFIFELINLQGNIEKPHSPTDDELAAKFAYARPKYVYDLGFISRCIIGGFAAPPTMLFFRPESYFALLAMSVVAGSAGTALFRSLQDRLLLAIAQKDTLEVEKEVRKENANAKLDKALEVFEILEKKLREVSFRPQLEPSLNFKEGAIFEFSYFDDFQNILAQLKGTNVQVDQTIVAYNDFLKEIRKISVREEKATEIKFVKDAKLPLIYLDNIRKLLNEAKGKNDSIITESNLKHPPLETHTNFTAETSEAAN